MNVKLPTLSRWNRETKMLLIALGILAVSFLGIEGLLKILYVLRLGVGPEYLGYFNASGALTYMAMSLPAGALGARFGPRRIMFLGGVVFVVGFALMPLAEFVPPWAKEAWPIAMQMLLTAGWCMFNVNMVPTLTLATTVENRSSAFAWSGVLRGLGTFLGTTLGGFLPAFFAFLWGSSLDSPGPYRWGLWLGAALGLGALIPLSRLQRSEASVAKKEAARPRGPFPKRWLTVLIAHVMFSHGGWTTTQAFASAYMDTDLHLSSASIGLIMGVGQFAAIVAPLWIPQLGRRFSNGWIMMICTLGMAVSLAPMALVPHWAAAGIGRFGHIVLSAVWLPALQVYQMERVEPAWRSLAYGALSMAMGMAFGLVSLGGGYVIASWGYRALFLIGAGLSAAGVLVMLAIMRRERFMPQESAAE